MSKYITDLQVSLNENDESQLRAKGFKKIDVHLNKGAGGKNIHLWYKTGDSGAITRIQFTFNDAMSDGLSQAGYHKINKNLNAGAGGKDVYLWFFKGSSEDDVPIVNLDVSTTNDAKKFKADHETLACDLNQEAGGHQIFLSVKREKATYISDITVTNNWEGMLYYLYNGYMPMWPSTNFGTQGPFVFMWYRLTTKPEEAIRDLRVSINDDEYLTFLFEGYKLVNMDVNQGTGGNQVYLWHKKDDCDCYPIKAIGMICAGPDPAEIEWWEVILQNLNAGVKDAPELFLCFCR